MSSLSGFAIPAQNWPAADHTYVECGTGKKAWGCFGRKSGGSQIISGAGSSLRANAIAEPNERAGLKVYGVNGVCHQAANRILLPARRLVSSARGYSFSVLLFGPYGREFLGTPIASPLNLHAGITGDDQLCVGSAKAVEDEIGEALSSRLNRPSDKQYINSALKLYAGHFAKHEKTAPSKLRFAIHSMLYAPRISIQLQLELFALWIEYHSPRPLPQSKLTDLNGAFFSLEIQRASAESKFLNGETKGPQYAGEMNEIVLEFQEESSKILDSNQYRNIFQSERTERIAVVDPSVYQKEAIR